MSLRVTVEPQLLRWARERAALAPAQLAKKVGLKKERVTDWEATGELTLAHLERVANKTCTPLGYFFLPAPPREELPVTDFRTIGGDHVRRPSPNLLDTIYHCQQRQNWYRDYLIGQREEPLPFIGSASLKDAPATVAHHIRAMLGLDSEPLASVPTWEEALRILVEKVESHGILVMRNGIVGNNTHRKLSVSEFRGFVLSDEYAPLVFVNAADSKSAQMFTLAHELGHLWLGQSGVSDLDLDSANRSERYCNVVAAEVLVPMAEFQAAWRPGADGDFCRTQGSRLGKRFATAVIANALEGRTPYKEAFRLLGVKKGETFDELARSLGVSTDASPWQRRLGDDDPSRATANIDQLTAKAETVIERLQ